MIIDLFQAENPVPENTLETRTVPGLSDDPSCLTGPLPLPIIFLMAASSSDSTLSMNTVLNLISNRLTSANYLLWKNQLLPLHTYQNLLPLVDGTSPAPPSEQVVAGKPAPNSDFAAWQSANQRAVILLQASLSEEAFSEVVGLSTAREIWLALEAAYSSSSVERIQNLRDKLRQISKGSSSVAEFGRKFRSLFDQLAAIGQPVVDSDKVHWFFCGLGAPFETFSTAIRASRSSIGFRDLLAQAKGHELFLQSIHGSVTPTVAFTADSPVDTRGSPSNQGRGGRSSRGGRGRGGRRPRKTNTSLPCVFLGYCSQYKGFQCLEPTTSRIFVSRHTRFDEQCFPFDSEAGQSPAHMLALSEFCDAAFAAAPSPSSSPAPATAPATSPSSPSLGVSEDFSPPVAARTPDPSNDAQSAASHGNDSEGSSSGSDGSDSGSDEPYSSADDTDSDDSVHDEPPPEPASPVPPTPSPRRPPPPSHPMITRAKAGIFKPRYRADFASTGLVAALHASTDPRGFKTASRYPHWLGAMQDELDALKRNNTFVLVPRPVDHNVVGCKWIFRTKYLADGSIDRHKARLVAQGFIQVLGLDFSHTFSPVVKASTVITRFHQLTDVSLSFVKQNSFVHIIMRQGGQKSTFWQLQNHLKNALNAIKQIRSLLFHVLCTPGPYDLLLQVLVMELNYFSNKNLEDMDIKQIRLWIGPT
ncbi:hypothetical protein LXL04_032271 [Taraxacum kok-saghyz]